MAALAQSHVEDIHKFFRADTGSSINPKDELPLVVIKEEKLANENFESDQQEENVDTHIGDSNVSVITNIVFKPKFISLSVLRAPSFRLALGP